MSVSSSNSHSVIASMLLSIPNHALTVWCIHSAYCCPLQTSKHPLAAQERQGLAWPGARRNLPLESSPGVTSKPTQLHPETSSKRITETARTTIQAVLLLPQKNMQEKYGVASKKHNKKKMCELCHSVKHAMELTNDHPKDELKCCLQCSTV